MAALGGPGNNIMCKSQIRDELSKVMDGFLQGGGQVTVCPTRKRSPRARNRPENKPFVVTEDELAQRRLMRANELTDIKRALGLQ